MAETRQEFLDWAKARALEYVDMGDLPSAYASLISDLGKNPEVFDRGTPVVKAALKAGFQEVTRGPEAMRHWIEGFQ